MFVVYTAGAFIGCVDNVKRRIDKKECEDDKRLIRRRKFDKVTNIDKVTKGV